MYIKISKRSQLVMLRNMNPFLEKYKVPREVLHEIGNILEFECSGKRDYIALFLHSIKNDTAEILDELQIYPLKVKFEDDNFHHIDVKRKKHKIWSWYEIKIESEERRIFVVYPMKKKDLYGRGGL